MYTEGSLAAAQLAKVFGSELLGIQEKARTDSGSQPQILKMHPTQFLNSTPQHSAHTQQKEKRLMEALQREAEFAHPSAPEQPTPLLPPQVQPTHVQQQSTPVVLPETTIASSGELKKLNENLERIAVILEKSVELFSKASNVDS